MPKSTVETEYIPATAAKNRQFRKLLCDLKFNQKKAAEVFIHNRSAIALAKNPVNHGRAKHISVRYHAI